MAAAEEERDAATRALDEERAESAARLLEAAEGAEPTAVAKGAPAGATADVPASTEEEEVAAQVDPMVAARRQAAAEKFRVEALTEAQKAAEAGVQTTVDAAAKGVTDAAKACRAIGEALEKGDSTKTKMLLKKGSALAARYGAQQRTPLHYAAAKGDLKLVQHILGLEGGIAGVTVMDAEGRSAAHLACAAGHAEVAKELVLKGKADLRLRDANGCSVLQLLPSEAARQDLRSLQPL